MPKIDDLVNSGSAAVDIRLGTWFVTPRNTRLAVLNLVRKPEDHIDEAKLTKRHYVPFGGQFILHPRSFVLAATLEWIRLPADLAGYIHGRSSWGRRGLIIATASGIHPGFTGCLTLELTNLGEIPIEITPGMAICQLFFSTRLIQTATTVTGARLLACEDQFLEASNSTTSPNG
jgi:dCTP deaminase